MGSEIAWSNTYFMAANKRETLDLITANVIKPAFID